MKLKKKKIFQQKKIVARVQVRVVINYNNFVCFQMTTRTANTWQVCTRRQSSGGATSGIRHDIGRVKEIRLQTQIVGRRDRPVWVGLHWARWAGLTRIFVVFFLFAKNRNFMNNRPQWRNFCKKKKNRKKP